MPVLINPYRFAVMSLSAVGTRTNSSGVASTLTINMPSEGIAAGDLAVAFGYSRAGFPATVNTPSGWTSINQTDDGSGTSGRSVRKTLAGSETDIEFSNTLGGANGWVGGIIVLRPSVSISSVTPSTWDEQATNDNPGSQSVAASGGVAPLAVFGFFAGNITSPAFSTASPAFDATVTETDDAMQMVMGYKIYNTSPLDHTIDGADLGNFMILQSGYISVA